MSLVHFIILFLILPTNRGADLNVGTTLFTKADCFKECWSSESLALLTSRMILEDLLPSTSILVIDSNDFVTDLVEYFRLILETVREETHGKTKHITLVALTDLLGGYLNHAVLPIAKFAYYAGLIDYDSMATLLGLFDELKWFLRTNGQGWAKPLTQNQENFEVQRIPLQPCNDKSVCENILLVEAETGGNDVRGGRCDVTIPLPFFDSLTRPSAIALPTKSCPLHNVEANSSSYLVMKFFLNAYKCLQAKNTKSENLEKFQVDFCGWIEEQIVPRLADEKFYAAFGGIFRVRNTLKRLGMSQSSLNKQISDFQRVADNAVATEANTHQMSRSSMILMAVLITIFVWFILGTLFICYRMKNSKKNVCDDESCPGADKTTHSTSLCSSKYFYPERPKTKESKHESKGTSSAETDSGESDLDVSSYARRRYDKKKYPIDSLHYHKFNLERVKGGPRHEINIRTCHCHDSDDEDEGSTTNQTEGRLPSITEMSESATTDSKPKGPSGASTPKSNKSNKRARVQTQVYEDLDETTEETSEPS